MITKGLSFYSVSLSM